MARLEAVFGQTRRLGEREGGLGDVVARLGFDAPAEFIPLLGGAVGPDEHAVAARFADGFHDHFIQVIDHVALLFVVGELIGFDVVQNGIFVEVVADDGRNVAVDGLVIGHARAQGVGQRHVSRPIRIEKPGNAQHGVGAEGQRIGEIVVDATVDDVDAPQPRRRSHVDDVVVRQQVASLDQLDAHLTRQVGMLEIGRIEDARAEHDDGRFGAPLGRERAQRAEQRLAVLFDRQHAATAEQQGKELLHDDAVGQHVGSAARHAQIVFQDDELAVGQAHDVRAHDGHVDVAGHVQAPHLPPELFAAIDDLPRNNPIGENVPLVVNVAEKHVERGDPLRQSPFDEAPFRMRDDARQKIVGEDALGAFLVAVNAEGDPLIQKRHVGEVLPPANLVGGQGSERIEDLGVVLAHAAFRDKHLVVGFLGPARWVRPRAGKRALGRTGRFPECRNVRVQGGPIQRRARVRFRIAPAAP